MEFSALPTFKHYVWKKLQEGLDEGEFPYSDQIKYMAAEKPVPIIVTISWEIVRNALTSDLDITIFIEELPEDETMKKLDVQLTIPTPYSCEIESLNIDITNWDEIFDKEYDSLPEKIKDIWNNI